MEIYIGFVGFCLFVIGMVVLVYNLPESKPETVSDEDWYEEYRKSNY